MTTVELHLRTYLSPRWLSVSARIVSAFVFFTSLFICVLELVPGIVVPWYAGSIQVAILFPCLALMHAVERQTPAPHKFRHLGYFERASRLSTLRWELYRRIFRATSRKHVRVCVLSMLWAFASMPITIVRVVSTGTGGILAFSAACMYFSLLPWVYFSSTEARLYEIHTAQA